MDTLSALINDLENEPDKSLKISDEYYQRAKNIGIESYKISMSMSIAQILDVLHAVQTFELPAHLIPKSVGTENYEVALTEARARAMSQKNNASENERD